VPPVVPPPPLPLPLLVPDPSPTEVDATCPAAALTGAAAPPAEEPLGVAVLSSAFASTETLWAVGQALKETSPTRVTKTRAAQASRAPEAPIPTMKLSGVLLLDVLVAA
jgi:hypothetical protein